MFRPVAAVMCILVMTSKLASGTVVSRIFRQYEIQPVGCQNSSAFMTKLHCAVGCQSNSQCHMFAFGTHCQMCYGSDISQLNFPVGQFYYFKEHACWHNMAPEIILTVPLSYGMVLRFTVTPERNDDFTFNLAHNSSGTWPLIMLFRMNVGGGFVMSAKGSTWDAGIPTSQPLPFAVGQTTFIRVLITQDKYIIYFNDVHAADYLHVHPFEDINYFLFHASFVSLDQFCY